MFKIFSFIILLATFLGMVFSFGYLLVKEHEIAVIIPCIIGVLGALCMFYLLFFEIFVGHKSFYCEFDKLYVKRKHRTIDVVEKSNIKNLTFVYDMVLERLHIISFESNEKKYYITVGDDNEKLISFFDGLKYTKRKNYWYYFIEIFTF